MKLPYLDWAHRFSGPAYGWTSVDGIDRWGKILDAPVIEQWLEDHEIGVEFFCVREQIRLGITPVNRTYYEAEFTSEADALLFKMTWL